MCGLIGYIGYRNAAEVLLSGLKKLEYRGYDSSGMAVMREGAIQIRKKAGRVERLKECLEAEPIQGKTGIGHTRWATHGATTDYNSHPFLSYKARFSVAHNGIIENYAELKDELCAGGAKFVSDTDSEVVAHLIDMLYEGDVRLAILGAVAKLKGSFALAILTTEDEGALYAVRRDSPLVIGHGCKENYICSDIISLSGNVRTAFVLPDCSVSRVCTEDAETWDFDGVCVTLDEVRVDADDMCEAVDDYMKKELWEIPGAIARARDAYVANSPFASAEVRTRVSGARRIYFVGCGTAYHACCIGAETLRRLSCNADAYAVTASEFRYGNYLTDENTLTVCVSQSGETADTLLSAKLQIAKGCFTIAVCNQKTSSLAKCCDWFVPTAAGAEIAVASTKAYNAQLVSLILFAVDFAYENARVSLSYKERIYDALCGLPMLANECLGNCCAVLKYSKCCFCKSDVFFIGRGTDCHTAAEGSLKLKEISYIHSEAYPAGELKHGALALIKEGVCAVGVMTSAELKDKMLTSLKEIKTRGGEVALVTQFSGDDGVLSLADAVLALPETESVLMPVISVIPLQLLAYFVSKEKGLDADKPRNLAKSVTVE